MTRQQIRSLIMETIRESGFPDTGFRAKARRLTALSALKDQLIPMYMDLRQLNIDALDAHETGDMETYRQIKRRINDLEGQIAPIKAKNDALEAEEDT